MAALDAETLAKGLGLRRSGNTFTGRCPACGYETGFTVISRNQVVLFSCRGGDGCSQGEIIAALQALGLWPGKADRDWRPPPRPAPRDRADTLEAARAAALALWGRSRSVVGTIAETYLRGRGIVVPLPPTLRFLGACRHGPTGRDLPAMIAAVTVAPSTRIVAVHRTFLDPTGTGKADIAPNKMSLGPLQGGAVRLAPAGPGLIIAEGIETTLSAMQASGRPGWAALSAGGIRTLVLPPDVRDVTICADADPVGLGAAEAAAARWCAEGRRVRIAVPPDPKTDFNDLVRAESARGACHA